MLAGKSKVHGTLMGGGDDDGYNIGARVDSQGYSAAGAASD
jgi:hypothetical protein